MTIVRTTGRLLLLVVVSLGVAGCKGKSPAGKYNIDQNGYGFGPGADKIILDLRGNGTFDVKAGPLTLLDGTWKSEGGNVIFSGEQGAIVTTYRIEPGRLIPRKDGNDVTGWRWKRVQ